MGFQAMNWLTFFVPFCFEIRYNSHSKQNNTGHHDGNGYSKNHHRAYRTKQAYDGNRYSPCKNYHRARRTKSAQVSWSRCNIPQYIYIQACADEENFTAEGGARGFFDSFIEYSVEPLLNLCMYMIIKIKLNIITCTL